MGGAFPPCSRFSYTTLVWQANKIGFSILLIGLAALGAAYWHLMDKDLQLAKQVLAGGICLLLFGVATGTWLSARRDLRRYRGE